MPRRRDILSEERNIADVLSDVLTSVPGILQQGADTRNQQAVFNLEQMTGSQERKAKSKHQRFMEQIAAGTLFQRQQAAEAKLAEDQRQFDIEQTADTDPLSSQGKQIQDLMDRFGLTQEEAINRVFKPEDPQKATKDLISQLVKSRGTKTKTVQGIESIEPAGTGFLGTGLFAAPPDTTFGEQKIPFGADELQAFMDSLNTQFGITGGNQTALPAPVESTAVSQQTLDAKRKRLAELKAKAGN